jgi:hypothetical protein
LGEEKGMVGMGKLDLELVNAYITSHIGDFHENRIRSLDNLKLLEVIKRKNPYLYKAKNLQTSETIVRAIVDAHISSNEEAIFGDWLERLAIFINNLVFDGWKSGIPGIDLEFDNTGVRYIVSIKSGPNWANSKQIEKMLSDFSTAKKTLRTSNSHLQITAINGCCYGRERKFDKGEYYKYCGQKFWSFLSGDDTLFLDIIEPLGINSKVKNDEYEQLYVRTINRFTIEFSNAFCKDNGDLEWDKIVRFNSAE